MAETEDTAVSAERWMPVVGWEGWYEVSDLGWVRRVACGASTTPGRILRPASSNGYLVVKLSRHNKPRSATVHTLVLNAFVGPRPEGMECRHVNGDKRECRLSNLAWGTDQENANDRLRHGTVPKGSEVHCSRLTPEDVRVIRGLIAAGRLSLGLIARQFGVSRPSISDIKLRRTWAHVD